MPDVWVFWSWFWRWFWINWLVWHKPHRAASINHLNLKFTNSRNKARLCWRKPSLKRTFCPSSHNKSQDKSINNICLPSPPDEIKSNWAEDKSIWWRCVFPSSSPDGRALKFLFLGVAPSQMRWTWSALSQNTILISEKLEIVHCLLASTTKIRLLYNRAR